MPELQRIDELPGSFGYGAGVLYGLPQPPRWMGEVRPDLQKVILLLDTSESMQYRSAAAPLSKLAYAECIAASLAFLVLHQHDSISLATFDNEVRQLIRGITAGAVK